MVGLTLAFLTAAIDTIKTILTKKLSLSFKLIVVSWAWQFFSLIVLIPAFLLTKVPTLNMIFWVSSSIKIILFTLSVFLYTYSLKNSDLSLSMPMLAFVPVLVMLISFFINKETPTVLGILGVIIICLGIYLLNFEKGNKDFFNPIRSIIKNKGVRFMFFVALLWSVCGTLDKTAVRNSQPIFYSFYTTSVISLLLSVIFIFNDFESVIPVFRKTNLKRLVPLGITAGLLNIIYMLAISYMNTAYVIAIKRFAIVLTTILGHFIYGEKIRRRIFPIVVTFIGILLIVLA